MLLLISFKWTYANGNNDNPINHIFFKLSIKEVEQISSNKFLQMQFSDFFSGESGDANQKWNAVYIQGESTYLEIFDKNGTSNKANIGLAFASNQIGALDNNLFAFSQNCVQPYKCEVKSRLKNKGDTDVWFKQFKWLGEDDLLDVWIMEYGLDYVTKKPTFHGSSWANNDISAKRYNSQWYKPHLLMKDVELVEMEVSDSHLQLIQSVVHTMKMNILEHDDLIIIVSRNTNPRFILKPGTESKIVSITFSLTREVQSQIIKISDRSEMLLNKKKAVWVFK